MEGTRKRSFKGGRSELRKLAMATLWLLRNDQKKLLSQVKQMVKTKPELARQIFITDVDGWTPIHACAMRGSKKLFKTMLSVGIDLNAAMGEPQGLPGRCTLLHVAANRKSTKVLDYLLSHGADVNAQDSCGRTPVYYANLSQNRPGLKLLQSHGAVLPASGETPPNVQPEELVTPEPRLNKFCFALNRS